MSLTDADFLLSNKLFQFASEDDLTPVLSHSSIVGQKEVGVVAVEDGGVDLGAGNAVVRYHHLCSKHMQTTSN